MTIGIADIGYHIASDRIDLLKDSQQYDVPPEFIKKKTGFVSLARKAPSQKASDLCVSAYKDLCLRVERKSALADLDFLCVCTQNGDYQIPQTSAVVQHKLGISNACASFDISLGCSGYVYALHIAKSFMENNGLKKGLLFTSDPYSDILDAKDKHTGLIFGDSAAVTLLSDKPVFNIHAGVFATHGDLHDQLIKRKNEKLQMNGRAIFNFTIDAVPKLFNKTLEKNKITIDQIDYFVFHQANKFMLEYLRKILNIPKDKFYINLLHTGNTVSATIPIALKDCLDTQILTHGNTILILGFGVGYS